MKAAQINHYGSTDAITINEADKPQAAAGQVVVAVKAASINPFDTMVREGHLQQMVPLQLPVTLGGDLAGTVVEVGADVTRLNVSDRVYGQANAVSGASGAFAEFAATSATQVALAPTKLSDVEAAALPLTGLSALQVITGHLKLQPGQKILIHGGAGGIGTIAIQLAKHIGAYVAATATGDGINYVKSLGADVVIDYKSQAFENELHDFDAVFDTVAGETYTKSFQVLKKGGTIVSMLEQPNTELAEQYGVTAIAQQTVTTPESLEALAKLADDGVIKVHVNKVFPLAQTAEAFKARESGSAHGKVVISIPS